MFLEGLLKRRLSSLLQPWLAEEPELDLQLGFINSSVIAKNLRFSAPALNQLMDASSRLLFKEFVIEQFVFRFSNWSAAAFTFEAIGIHVTLSLKEAEEEASRKVSRRGLGSPESVKRAISKIDPEGTILHSMVDAILTSYHSTSLSSSFLHLVLQHCHSSIHEIHLQVLLPVRTVPIAYQLEIKDINAESVLSDRCFARGLLYLILQPVKEGSFDINVEGFEAGYKRSGNYSNVCHLTHLSSHVKRSNFKLVELNTRIPELLLLCSPVDLSVIFVLFKMLTKQYKRVRSGQQLWRLAASRINQLVAAPRFMFYNLICLVCLWLRYVGSYERILNQLGYSTDHSFERSIVKMSKDKVFLTSVKHSWQVISSLEEQLPVEAIARARRLGRFRALSNCQCEHDRSLKFLDKAHLLGLFRVIYRISISIVHLLGQRKYLTENSIGDGYMGIHNRPPLSSLCFILSLGKFYVTIQPTKGTEVANGRKEPHYETPSVLSFRLSIKEFLLVSIEGTLEQSLSLSCGKLKGNSFIGSLKKRTERTDTCTTILHVDPARMFFQPEVDAADGVKDKSHARIERCIGEMCFNWKRACEKFEASCIRFPGVPCVLFELKSFLTHPFVKERGCGLQKYCATIGKFNAVLEYSSILSLILIIRQTSHVLHSTQVARTQVLSVSQTTIEKSEVEWDKKYDSFVNGTKSAFLRVLPEKDIELSMHIVGPHIQMFPRKHGTADANENTPALLKDIFLLGFDLQDIEFVVWPTSKSDIAATNDSIILDNEDQKSFRFQQPQMVNIPKPNDERHQFQQWISLYYCLTITGVKVYLEGITVKLQNPILVVEPIQLQLSSYREFLHGLNTTLIFSSTTSKLLVMGFNLLLFMDELCALSQVTHGLCPLLSFSTCGFSSILEVHPHLLSEMVIMHEEFESGSTSVQVESLSQCCPLFLFNSSFKLMSLDILLGNCRTGKYRSDNIEIHDALNSKVSPAHYLSDCGIWISIHRTCLELLFEERKLELLVICMEVQAVTIPSQEFRGGTFDRSILRRLLLDSPGCLYELFFSHSTLILSVSPSHNLTLSRSGNEAFRTATSECNSPYSEEYLHVRQEAGTTFQSNGFAQKLGFAPNGQSWDSNHWVLTRVAVSEIFVARCSVKNLLVSSQPFNKLLLSLSVAGKFQTITCGIQGGHICLEVPALAEFIDCSSSFLPHINGVLSTESSKEWQLESAIDLNDCYSRVHVQDNLSTAEGIKLDMLETFNADISQFSTILIDGDESDSVWELMTELDLILKVHLAEKRRNFAFELHRLTISSQVLHESFDQKEAVTSHFSSGTSCGDRSSQAGCGSGLRDPVPTGEVEVQSCISKVFSLSDPVNIVKHLVVSLSAEKLESMPDTLQNVWEGRGLVSGLDMTISLSELKRFLSISSTLAHVSSGNQSVEPRMSDRSHNQEVDNSFEMLVPDGAIVAVQDVDQHMYFMVEGEADKYTLAGTLHYSIACERALFQVKHHFQRKWNSSVLWFSLTSLYAKNSSDRPLQLSSRPGLGFVDICCANDFSCSLWRVLPVVQESFEGDIDWAPYIQLLKSTFHLVNKKNDCAVGFIDGVPEFVSKPGNPFKLKVLNDFYAAFNVMRRSRLSANTSEMEKQATVSDNGGERPGQSGSFPCISIVIEDASLTIVDELSHTKDRLPLLRGCINHTELTLHVLASKSRVITRFIATLLYFDGQTCSWMDLLRPTEMNIFYRSRFKCQEAESVHDGVPIFIYCRAKALEIFLVELSLDVLLYFLGKLNLAGPFSVRSSMIMANCCKVYNQTSLNLSCNFSSKQSVTVGGKHSASILLRHSALSDQQPENAPSISFALSVPESFTTTPVQFSLEEDRVLALRTRIVSVQDSQMHPGPVIVVDISRRSEDGVSIAVSPLICIRNETKFSMELRFRRPDQDNEVAFVPIKSGEQIEDSVASFEAINLPAGLKKALRSLSVGNILFSFRPEKSNDGLMGLEHLQSVDWSEEIRGGKAVRLSGIFEKLQYEVRKAFSVGSAKYSFSTTSCTLKSSDGRVSYLYFLIQSVGREVPLIQPKITKGSMENKDPPKSLHEQKEIFLLPTVCVSNLLALNVHVSLDDNDTTANPCSIDIGKKATITCGSTDDFYANPEVMVISVTLVDFGLRCKALNSTEWTKKLLKHKRSLRCLDIDLDFGGAKVLAHLRLSRGHKGMLEATIYTSYTLKNKTDFSLFFFPPNLKPLSRNNIQKLGSNVPPELGLLLPPQSTGSWFLKSHKVLFKLVEDNASETLFNLDALSGQTEISLEVEQGPGVKCIAHLGVSVGASSREVNVPSQIVTFVPRHVVRNMSAEIITVRQCNLQDEAAGVIVVNCKQTATLLLRSEISKRKEYNLFENLIKKHRNDESSLVHVQFHVNESQLGWSGPLCITSLGRFFLKFQKPASQVKAESNKITEYAEVHVVEEGPSIEIKFYKPQQGKLPYRIENRLHGASVTYYQKDSSEQEVLGSECSAHYVWDDLTLPRKLVVIINNANMLREIKLDKVRTWRPFYKSTQQRGLLSHVVLAKTTKETRSKFSEFEGINVLKAGYEVYADGPVRVLRICEVSESYKGDKAAHSGAKVRLRLCRFAVHLLEQGKQDLNERELPSHTPIVVARLQHIFLDSLFADQQKYNRFYVQSLNVDEKWAGAPFASMVRQNQLDLRGDCVLKVHFVLHSAVSSVTQITYLSVLLQPIDLNLDEDTMMKLVSFWRRSLSESTQSRQFYFEHFEVHPIKIFVNFVPSDSYSSYNSAQETLRSLLHSVIKVPPIRNMVVELNGVLVTHALITLRELIIKCSQHYSWYAMRAIYIAKGSPLLPPGFASIFDDMSSSSLDVFFDPSRGLLNLPGFTLGTFKLLSKCIDGKGFSGTKRYLGDLGNTLRAAGSNIIFAALTEISDSVLRGAEASGFDGMVSGVHHGILKLAMEPSVLGSALMGGGPDRKIKLDRSPGVDEMYIEGYLQAMLDTMFRQEYLRVRVIDDQVIIKNLPPNSSLIDEIMNRVKGFLISKALLKGDPSATPHPLHHLRGENEWRLGPTVMTLCEHLFVSYAIRMLRKQASKVVGSIKWSKPLLVVKDRKKEDEEEQKVKLEWRWGITKFLLSGILAYVDGRLCRSIPHPLARRIVSGFLLSFLDKNDDT